MIKIPKGMSTQHPDNVNPPFFAKDLILGGEDEVQEAYYAFSHLGCDEQMWDCEGKEVDNYVVKKLLTTYPSFFRENKLGEEVFLTLRVPNPTVEKAESKVLLEMLESIPRSFDAAQLFYGEEIAPIFEVILPMTASAQRLGRLSEEIGIPLYPIIGVGSAPFRGNLKPQTVERVAKAYPSVHTFTIQSVFKYDNPPDEVRAAIQKLHERETGPPQAVDEERCLEIIKKYCQAYQEQIAHLAPVINKVARSVPSRRRRIHGISVQTRTTEQRRSRHTCQCRREVIFFCIYFYKPCYTIIWAVSV